MSFSAITVAMLLASAPIPDTCLAPADATPERLAAGAVLCNSAAIATNSVNISDGNQQSAPAQNAVVAVAPPTRAMPCPDTVAPVAMPDATATAGTIVDKTNSELGIATIDSPAVLAPQPDCADPFAPVTLDPYAPTDADGEQFADDGDTIVVTARPRIAADPLERANLESFAVVQKLDGVIVAPAAEIYKDAVPSPIRSGIRNFLSNLTEPITALNYLLQLKPGKAAETIGRFAVNTTIGVGGLFDIAKREPFNLPKRRNGFANTLGFYGVKPGAYLYLPLIGSTTVRDFIGGTIDLLIYPTFIGSPFDKIYVTAPIGIVTGLGDRIEDDEKIRRLRDESPDGYSAVRDEYLQRRQATIDELRGKKTVQPEPATSETNASGTGAAATPAGDSGANASSPQANDDAAATTHDSMDHSADHHMDDGEQGGVDDSINAPADGSDAVEEIDANTDKPLASNDNQLNRPYAYGATSLAYKFDFKN